MGIVDIGVVSTAAAIYNRPESNVTISIQTRLNKMYGIST